MRRILALVVLAPMMASIASADIVESGPGFTFPGNGSNSGSLNVLVSETITDVTVQLDAFTHSWVGGLTVTLTGPGGGSMDLMALTGNIAPPGGGGDSSNFGGDYVFADGGADWWAAAAAAGNADIIAPGTYAPTTQLNVGTSFATTFGGTDSAGNWTLTITDSLGNPGSISGWTLNISSSAAIPEPGTLGLIGLAGLGLTFIRRRR